jgi:hypothetical protein
VQKKSVKELLKEGLENHDKKVVLLGRVTEATKHISNGYRELEAACQYCDDPELKKVLESIKLSLGHDLQVSNDFKTTNPTIISRLIEFIDNNKPD